MHLVPLFRGAALRPLLDYVGRAGCERIFGARLAILRDPHALLPLSEGGRAYELASLDLGLPDLGLRVGESTQLERIGDLGAMLRSAATIGGALTTAIRHGSRFNTGQRFWANFDGERVKFHRTFASALTRGRQQVSDFVLTILLRVIRLGAGRDWRPDEIFFEGSPPAHAEQLAALAENGVHFGSPTTVVLIPKRLLALPIPRPTAPIEAGPAAAPLPSTDALHALHQAVEALQRLGEPEVAAAASAAGTSVRSFQRRMRKAGLGYANVVQEVRRRAAIRLLADPGVKVIEVSAALGYTDSANFSRAFRRWTGLSPLAFRRAASELPIGVIPVTPAAVAPASLPIG